MKLYVVLTLLSGILIFDSMVGYAAENVGCQSKIRVVVERQSWDVGGDDGEPCSAVEASSIASYSSLPAYIGWEFKAVGAHTQKTDYFGKRCYMTILAKRVEYR